MDLEVCVVKSCINNKLSTKETGCQLHNLPQHLSLAHQWLKKCDRLDLRRHPPMYLMDHVYICSNHFTVEMCSSPEKIRLLPMAVPTEFESTGANCNEPTPSLDEAICPGLLDKQSNSCVLSTTQIIEHSNKSIALNRKMYRSYDYSLRRPQTTLFTNIQIAEMNQNCGYPVQPSATTPNPTIEFESLPFYKTIETILIPRILSNDNKTVYNGRFSLSNDLRCLINNSWNENLKKYKVRVILRLEQVGHKVVERLPYNLIVVVNNICCMLPMVDISKERRSMLWRCNVPINITELVNLKNDGFQNSIQLFWSREPHQYKAAIIVVEKLIGSELVEQLNGRPILPSFQTKGLIKNALDVSELYDDISTDGMVISIQDPLSKMRMQFPARGSNCVHIQCFDAFIYLLMNEKIENWKCPICREKLKFENIVVDQYFLDIIKSPCLSEECESVILQSDGSWAEKKINKLKYAKYDV